MLVIRAALAGAAAAGIDTSRVLSRVDIDSGVLANPDATTTQHLEEQVWRALAECSDGDPLFGLRAGGKLPRGSLGLFEYMLRTTDTVATALDLAERYGSAIHGIELFRRQETTLVYESSHPPEERFSWMAAQFALSATLSILSSAAASPLGQVRIELSHRAGQGAEPLDGVTSGLIRENAPRDALVLPRQAMSIRMTMHEPPLHGLLARLADERITTRSLPQDVVSRTRRLINHALDTAPVTVGQIARRLEISPRTLQALLRAQAATSFSELLREARLEVAKVELARGDTSVGAIAERIGYRDARSFFRAFQRWTGETPAGYRRRVRRGQ